MPTPRDLDRAAEQRLQAALVSSSPRAAVVTGVTVAALVAGVVTGLAVLGRGPVCEALDQQAGGTYCVAVPTPTPTPGS